MLDALLRLNIEDDDSMCEIAIPSMAFPFEVIFEVLINIRNKVEFANMVTDAMNILFGNVLRQYSNGETCYFIMNTKEQTITATFPYLRMPLRRQEIMRTMLASIISNHTYLTNRFKLKATSEYSDGRSRVWLGSKEMVEKTWIMPVVMNNGSWTTTILYGSIENGKRDHEYNIYKTLVETEAPIANGPNEHSKSSLNAGSNLCVCRKCLNTYDIQARDSDSGVYDASGRFTKLSFIATKLWSNLSTPYKPKPMYGLFDDISVIDQMLKVHPTTIPMNTLQDEECRKSIFLPCLKISRFEVVVGDADKSFDALKVFTILGEEAFNAVRRSRAMGDLTIRELNFLELMSRNQEFNLTYLTLMHYASQDDPRKFNQIMGEQILNIYMNGICADNTNMIWQAISYRLMGMFYSYLAPASNMSGFTNNFYRFNGTNLEQEPNIDTYIFTSLTSGNLRSIVDEIAILCIEALSELEEMNYNCSFTEFCEELGTYIVPNHFKRMIETDIPRNINGVKIQNVVKVIKTNLNHIASVRCKFDNNPCCFGVGNGVLYTVDIDDAGNSKLLYRPCEPEDYVTKFSKARYDESLINNKNYQILEYRLRTMFPDPQVCSWVLSYMAGCFRGVPPKIAMFLHGGRNTGKTSLSSLMTSTLGNSYTSPLGCDYFIQTKTDTSKPNPTVVSAVRGRLTTIEEFKGTINCEVFKEKTGGRTRVTERSLYQSIDEGGTVSMSRFLFLSNSLPMIRYDPAAINRIGLITLTARYEAARAITKTSENSGVHEEVNNLADQYRRQKDEMLMLLVAHYDRYRCNEDSKFCDLENVPDAMKVWRMAILGDSPIFAFISRNIKTVPHQNRMTLAIHDLVNILRSKEEWEEQIFADVQSEVITILPNYQNYGGVIGWDNIVFCPQVPQNFEEYVAKLVEEYSKCGPVYTDGFCLPYYRDIFSKKKSKSNRRTLTVENDGESFVPSRFENEAGEMLDLDDIGK